MDCGWAIVKSGRFIRMRFSWSRQEMMVAWARVSGKMGRCWWIRSIFCRTWRSIGCGGAGKEAVKCGVQVLLPDGWYDLLRAGNSDIKRYWDKSRVFRCIKCEM